jgi:SulP family sulfate permease
MAQGVGNLAGAFFAYMGSCAMIEQSMINLNAGGRRRLSGIAAGLFLLTFIRKDRTGLLRPIEE